MEQGSKKLNNYYLSYGLITVVIIYFLYWSAALRITDFENYHKSLAESSTTALADQVSHFISERKRLVTLFADKNKASIKALMLKPNDIDTYETLAEKVKEFFPSYFSFTITDLSGKPYYLDMEGSIGEVCLSDINLFSQSGVQRQSVHPNSGAYHFDVMSKFKYESEEGLLFVSFHANLLSRFIKASQSISHQTILALISDRIWIEAFDIGPRTTIPREDYRLSDEEKGRILSKTKVLNTKWYAIDSHAPNLFVEQRFKIYMQMMWVTIIILSIVGVSLYLLIKEERLRKILKGQKEDYLAMLNHELRTPITGIQGSLELITKGILGEVPEKVKQFAAASLINCHRLLSLINDMLDYDKLTTGNFDLKIRNENILTIVENAMDEIKGYVSKYHTKLTLIADRNLDYSVQVDKKIINQVFQNLISNASKYGSENDTIDIKLEKDNEFYIITITDHGQGIPEEYLDSVFDKYTVVDNHKKESVMSTGLGLHITKSFVELHHGYIFCKSEVGKGTSFIVKLPVYNDLIT